MRFLRSLFGDGPDNESGFQVYEERTAEEIEAEGGEVADVSEDDIDEIDDALGQRPAPAPEEGGFLHSLRRLFGG